MLTLRNRSKEIRFSRQWLLWPLPTQVRRTNLGTAGDALAISLLLALLS